MGVDEAMQLIWDGYEQGTFYPAPLRGALDLDTALHVQLAVLERRQAGGERLAGWKIGLTSASVRAHFGSDDQPFGHLLGSGVLASNTSISLADLAVGCGVEPELCFTMKTGLAGPNATPETARAAVASVSAGFEINQKRSGGVNDFGLAVADNLTQWAIVVGDTATPVPDEFDSDSLHVVMRCDGATRADVVGADVIDDHFDSIAKLANILAPYGYALDAEQRLITGSFSKHDVSAGETWEAEFSGIGTVRASFT